MFPPVEKNWLFELFREDMNQHARWFRRHFFYEIAMVIVTAYAAVQALLDYFWGDLFLLCFFKYGLWVASCVLWVSNAKTSFGKWREYRHYIK